MKNYLQALFLFLLLGTIFPAMAAVNHTSTEKALSLRHVERIGRDVTFIGLGALEIGRDWGVGAAHDRAHASEDIAKKTLATALQKGLTIIDTASSYHFSEERIGKYAKLDNEKNILVTKAGEYSILATDQRCKAPSSDKKYCIDPAADYDFSRAAIRRDVENSLRFLNTDQLDVVLIHFDGDPKEILDKGEAVSALKELKSEGKIRHIGISIDSPEQAIRCINMGVFDVIEVEYNLLNQSNKEAIALAKQKGMLVIVRGTLGTGLLTAEVAPYLNDPNLPFAKQVRELLKLVNNDYDQLTALALAFVYENNNISSAIIGAKTPEMLEKDIDLLNKFNNTHLLQRAKRLMKNYKPESFTTVVDNYFYQKNS